MTSTAVLALAAAVLLAVAAAFQLALGLGAPWAAAAYGGRVTLPDGRLPRGHRVASVVTVLVLAGIGWLLLVRGGVLPSASDGAGTFLTVAVWVVAALFALNTLGNLSGRHPVERWGMGAVTAALTVLSVLLAVGA